MSDKTRARRRYDAKRSLAGALAILFAAIVYCVPFYFVILNSFKTRQEASLMNVRWPGTFSAVENYKKVLDTNNGIVIRAFGNSIAITLFSILLMVVVCSMAGYVLQRKRDKIGVFANFVVLTGLMIPPAIVPTIWVMQTIGIYKSIEGMVLIEVALNLSFACILYRGFMASIPRELDEAAVIDGCGPFRMFWQVILPLLQPVTATVIVLSAVNIFNDFVNPLYFLPGTKNATVQQTLYNFNGQYGSDWNLLFADVMLITIPPLMLFIFFNKKIVSGMVAGAIKA
ncbi:carbohydrate ABC transporter permease [Bacillota bacterium Meth-B3]|nr:carbohydrate ABC transporter permease [Christensenellaceae bacterium]MEA5065382.1 carbohydrate ABC transporter permease [Eubacteriales bacterium]MEA5068808.1 carbohydrate ABC transporter permease [Christensenellaceae bacterium]